jgi:uncharacterized protein YcbX
MQGADVRIVGTVGEIWRYPVKSMRGQELHEVDVTTSGLPGDRGWAIVDRTTNKVGSAKLPRLWGRLLECEASRIDGVTTITLPDGRVVTAGTDEADTALRELTGRDVALMSRAPEGIELQRYWPDVEGMALRDQETTAPFAAAAPPGAFFDYAVLQVLTSASLDTLAAAAPDSRFDRRRFRPNLLIDTGDDLSGFVENDWLGRTLAIGDEVQLRITLPTPRCVITTLPQSDLPHDVDILRTISTHNRPAIEARDGMKMPCLGVYAEIVSHGVVRQGDDVRLL